jgi:hypothetical protein
LLCSDHSTIEFVGSKLEISIPIHFRPTDDSLGVAINHDSQISEALKGADIGDVCHLGLVRYFHIELPL